MTSISKLRGNGGFIYIPGYSRKEQTTKGKLIDLSQGDFTDLAMKCSHIYPIAISKLAFARYVSLDENTQQLGLSIRNRLSTLLWVLKHQIKGYRSTILFSFICVPSLVEGQSIQEFIEVDFQEEGFPLGSKICYLEAAYLIDNAGNTSLNIMLPSEKLF